MTRRVAQAAEIGALVLALALVPAAIAARGGGWRQARWWNVSSGNPLRRLQPLLPGYVHFTGSGYNASYPSAQVGVNGGCGFGVPVYANGTFDFSWNLSVPSS